MDVFIDMERLAAYRELIARPFNDDSKHRVGHRITAPQRKTDREKARKRLQDGFVPYLMERQLYWRGDL